MATLGTKNNLKLKFVHVPTGFKVEFPAYLENLADMFTSNWTAEDVYGRMDPITTFMNTRRAISLSWNVPADSYDDAKINMMNVNKLMSFLYPLYSEKTGAKGATAINQGPLMRVSFGNLIRESTTGKGLLGYVNGFTFDPRIENGMFYSEGGNAGFGLKQSDVEYYPKTILLNFELNVLHEHELGFVKSGNTFKFRNKSVKQNNFPYGVSLPTETEAAAFAKLAGEVGSQLVTATADAANAASTRIGKQIRNLFGPSGPPGGNPLGLPLEKDDDPDGDK